MSTSTVISLTQFFRDTGLSTEGGDLSQEQRLAAARVVSAPDILDEASDSAELRATAINALTQGAVVSSVQFTVSPTVSESRTADYQDAGLPGPFGVVIYKTTANRQFSVSAQFVSRNHGEARVNYEYVNNLRAWLIPQSANSVRVNNNNDLFFDESPIRPPVLRLNGYQQQFFNIPVVMSSLSVNYPNDVDYINIEYASVPIVQNVEVSLIETHLTSDTQPRGANPNREGFNISDFRRGFLRSF